MAKIIHIGTLKARRNAGQKGGHHSRSAVIAEILAAHLGEYE